MYRSTQSRVAMIRARINDCETEWTLGRDPEWDNCAVIGHFRQDIAYTMHTVAVTIVCNKLLAMYVNRKMKRNIMYEP